MFTAGARPYRIPARPAAGSALAGRQGGAGPAGRRRFSFLARLPILLGASAWVAPDRRRSAAVSALLPTVLAVSGCSKSSSSSAADAASGSADAGLPACTAVASTATAADGAARRRSAGPAGVADDFGPNAKIGIVEPSALGQLDVYEVTTPRRLEWVDLYLRADLGGTRLTISVYEAPATAT